MTKVELIRNGKAIRSFAPETSEFATKFLVEESGTAWYTVRAMGTSIHQVAISNPVYFEGSGYRPPKPAKAAVRLTVRDALTSNPLNGECEVLRMIGREPVVQSRTAFHNGELSIEVPATARLRISSRGYTPEVKSVFMDYRPLLDSVLNIRPEEIPEWSTFEKIRALLQNVALSVDLKPVASGR